MDSKDIRLRLNFWESALEKMQKAYLALVEGGVQSYTIDDRSLTRFDIPKLIKEINEAEKKVDQYKKLLRGGKRRKAFSIVPMDW